jgi:hypothetical protein
VERAKELIDAVGERQKINDQLEAKYVLSPFIIFFKVRPCRLG